MADPEPIADFTYVPDWNPAMSVEPAVAKVSFGDGYTQRFAKGINNQLQKIKLTFSVRSDTEASAIISFFEARAGCASFTFRLRPTDPLKKWVTEGEWQHTPWAGASDCNTITVTFQEVP